MVGVLGLIFSPKGGPIFIALVCVLVSVVSFVLGNVPGTLIFLGAAALVITAADLQIWKVSIPVGLVLILVGAGDWAYLTIFH